MINSWIRGLKNKLMDLVHLIIGIKALLRLLANESDRLSASHALHITSTDTRTTETQHQLSFTRIYSRIGKSVCLSVSFHRAWKTTFNIISLITFSFTSLRKPLQHEFGG